MATTKEPAAEPTATVATEPAVGTDAVKHTRQPDVRKGVRVRDKKTGEVIRGLVPRTWLDGRFPNLVEVPSTAKKEGK